jgi:deoxyribodipyrimidine photo-lyase
MQASQRTRFNDALEHAIARANEQGLPVVVCFGLTERLSGRERAALRVHAAEAGGRRGGTAEARDRVRHSARFAASIALDLSKHAALLVCDRGYLRHQKRWRDEVADGAKCMVVQVECDVVVPVEVVSDKAEYAARTIRPKIRKHWKTYLKPLTPPSTRSAAGLRLRGSVRLHEFALKVDRSVLPVARFRGAKSRRSDD